MARITDAPKSSGWKRPLLLPATAAVIAFLTDSLLVGTPLLANVAFIAGLVAFPFALFRKGAANERLHRLGGGLVLVAAGMAVHSWNGAQVREAKSRAEGIIAAAREYRREQGRWPGRLEEMIPKHLSRAPEAGNSPMAKTVVYGTSSDGKAFVYISEGLRGRHYFWLERGRWKFID